MLSFSSDVPYLTRGVIICVLFVSLCPCVLLQSVHWRKPRGTVSSSQTIRLIAACTKTAKAARCPPLTVGPTPAPNRSQTSRPTERSCARSPARLNLALVLQTDSFCPPAPPSPHSPHDNAYLSALGPAFLYRSRGRAEGRVREVLSCIKRFYLHLSLLASVLSLRLWQQQPPKRGSTAVVKDFTLFKRYGNHSLSHLESARCEALGKLQ